MNTDTQNMIARRRSAIFAACKENGLDNDARRQLVKSLTGKNSMTQCTLADLNVILNQLNRGRKGYQGRVRSTPSAERAPLMGKIDALLAEMHRVTGEVYTLRYADAIANRRFGITCVDMADAATLKKIVVALTRTLQSKRAKVVA